MSGLLDFLQSASNSVAGNVSAPVDGLAWMLRKLGAPIPSNPVGGSDWMEQKGLTKPVKQSGYSLAGETAGLISPMLAAAKAPQIARGLLQGADNITTPQTLSKQAGVFIGPSAKTWSAGDATRASALTDAGVDARTVWSETGTWKGPDGKWRQEIPDNAAKLKIEKGSSIYSSVKPDDTMGDVLAHAGLYKNYPSLSTIKAKQYPGLGASYGAGYTPETRASFEKLGIDVPNSLMENMNFGINAGKTDVIHEMQHAIQGREGFALGGNARGMAAAENRIAGVDPEVAYLRLAGEAEARAAQARIPLNAAQRRATFPADSYDTPLDQLIFRN